MTSRKKVTVKAPVVDQVAEETQVVVEAQEPQEPQVVVEDIGQIEAPTEEPLPTPPTPHTVDVGHGIRSRSSFGKTYYWIDTDRVRSAKGPNQLRGVIKWMLDHGVTVQAGKSMQGAEIGRRAVADGYVETQKLTGEVIFAYYIRRMEKEFGVEHDKTVHNRTNQKMA